MSFQDRVKQQILARIKMSRVKNHDYEEGPAKNVLDTAKSNRYIFCHNLYGTEFYIFYAYNYSKMNVILKYTDYSFYVTYAPENMDDGHFTRKLQQIDGCEL